MFHFSFRFVSVWFVCASERCGRHTFNTTSTKPVGHYSFVTAIIIIYFIFCQAILSVPSRFSSAIPPNNDSPQFHANHYSSQQFYDCEMYFVYTSSSFMCCHIRCVVLCIKSKNQTWKQYCKLE